MKNLRNFIVAGILFGFAIGADRAADHITAHRYLRYNMYRIFALDLQSYLNRWVIMAVAAAVALYVVWLVGAFIARWLWRRFLSHHIELRIRSGDILGRRFRAFAIAAAFFLLSGFLFNFLYRGYRYSPASLAGDLVILLAAVVTGVWLGRDSGMRWLNRLWSPVWGMGIRRIALLLVLFLLLLNGLIFVDGTFFPPKGPNVILICIDALRADHLSCYGYERKTSPNIDRFSEDALLFESTFSQCSWTNPSIASLFTSHYPSTHGVTAFWGGKANTLRKRMVLLAEVLKNMGYATGAFSANHLVQERLNFNQGFDTFNPVNAEYKPRAEDVNREALKWLSEHEDEPFFLYIHYMDVHGPYRPPPPFDSIFRSDTTREMNEAEYIKMSQYLLEGDIRDLNHYIDQYDGEIRYADHHIGKLLEWLREHGLLDNSIIVITADHGEEFFDHGWCGHGLTLYNELIRVPLIIRFPGTGGDVGARKERAQLVDIGPTVLDFLGARFPNSVEGESLLARGRKGGVSPEGRAAFSEEHEWQTKWDSPPKVAMIEGDYKYIYHTREGKVIELYNLRKDPGERENIANAHEEKVAEGTEKIAVWLNERKQAAKRKGLPREAPVLKKDDYLGALRALGYL